MIPPVDGEEMELREYVGLLRKWLWLILSCTLLAGVLAYVVSKNSTPIYEASSTLRVNQASNPATTVAYADVLTSERLARTYANLLTSRPVLEETARRLGIEVETLDKTVTVTPVRDTLLLTIKVEGPDARLLADTANVLPQVFIDRDREQQLGQVTQWREGLEVEIDATLADIARTQEELNAADDTQKTRLEASLAQYRTCSTLLANAQQATR
jgi:non-specific protein-tyrosine kinase